MSDNDLISRAAAIEAALDGADEWDGGCNPTREEYIREHMAKLPAVDAIPVEWMKKMLEKVNHAAEPHFAFMYVLYEWQETKSIEDQQAESEMRDWQIEMEER